MLFSLCRFKYPMNNWTLILYSTSLGDCWGTTVVSGTGTAWRRINLVDQYFPTDVILSRAAIRGTTISGGIKGFVGNSSFENVAHRENVTAPLLLLPRGNADNFSFFAKFGFRETRWNRFVCWWISIFWLDIAKKRGWVVSRIINIVLAAHLLRYKNLHT